MIQLESQLKYLEKDLAQFEQYYFATDDADEKKLHETQIAICKFHIHRVKQELKKEGN